MRRNEYSFNIDAFQITMQYNVLLILFCLGNVTENVSECIRYDAFGLRCRRIAGHRVCFAGARLSIRQYGSIVAFQHFVDNWTSGVHVQIDLETKRNDKNIFQFNFWQIVFSCFRSE